MTKYTNKLTLLGKSGEGAQRKLETFSAPPNIDVVSLQSDEFTWQCPVTNQPDFGTVELTYTPDEVCLESKSLKLYWQSFRNQKDFAEWLASKMLDDFTRVLDPISCTVYIRAKPRGGIPIVVFASYTRHDDDDDFSSSPQMAPMFDFEGIRE